MPKIDIRQWLGAFAAGTLSPEEERDLYKAALDDQDLFNELGEEFLLREALSDEAFRRELTRRLRELNSTSDRSGMTSLMAWIRRPEMVLATCMAIVALIFGIRPLFRPGSDTGTGEEFRQFGLMPPAGPGEQLAVDVPDWLWSVADPGQHAGVALDLDRVGTIPIYEVGESMRIEFSVPRESSVLLLRRDPSGSVMLLFPNAGRTSPLLQAGERVVVSSVASGDVEASGASDHQTLRLFVFPPGGDPLASAPNRQDPPLVEERRYRVVSRR